MSTARSRNTLVARQSGPAAAPWCRMAAGLAGLGLLLVAGCSTVQYPVNAPLARYQPQAGYRLQNFVAQSGAEKLLVTLMFSGGGARSAALSYGVLEELAHQPIRWQGQHKRLLDEVELVYGVSGGAITAAYYGLVGERIFTDFEARFLNADLQQQLIDNLASVGNLRRLESPRFGRGDLLAEQFDKALFDGATFADLSSRRKGPFVVISAADLTHGARFDFTQNYFDLLCSDLDPFPVARAVAASSAVPLLFAPVTLWNYAGSCGFEVPPALAAASEAGPQGPDETRAQALARDMASLLDRARRPYVHLVDGGVADNVAVRDLIDADVLADNSEQLGQALLRQNVRKAVFIVVDAATAPINAVDQNADVPSMRAVAERMGDIAVRRDSQQSLQLFRQAFLRWQEWARAASQAGSPPLDLYFIDVALRTLPDPRERDELLRLPTTLHLAARDVRRLRDAAGRLIRQSPDFVRLMAEIGEPVQP